MFRITARKKCKLGSRPHGGSSRKYWQHVNECPAGLGGAKQRNDKWQSLVALVETGVSQLRTMTYPNHIDEKAPLAQTNARASLEIDGGEVMRVLVAHWGR